MYKAIFLSPMIPSYDIPATVKFFQDILSFYPIMLTDNYAIIQKEAVTVHILPAGETVGQMECYLEVNGLDEWWNDHSDKLAGIPVKGPLIQDYGMKEVHIAIPSTEALLFIGEYVPKG